MGSGAQQTLAHATFELAAYQQARADVEVQLSKIMAVADRFFSETARDLVETGCRDLSDELFRIVVVGEFSRGKSTFINALLGDRVLPAAPYPVTTVLTCIRDGKDHAVRLLYRDGTDEGITPERFSRLVAPPEPIPGDPQSQEEYELALRELERIERADLQYPSSLCSNGVEIVDTPGTNDINTVREQITYEFIPRADAVIFLLNALEAVTASEVVFLRDRVLKSDVQRIFFVVNFADRLSPDESSRVIARVQRELDKIVPSARVFLVSSKQALKIRTGKSDGTTDLSSSGVPQFESALASFLQQERTVVKLRKPVWRGIRACREIREHAIAVATAALDVDAGQLREKIREVQPRIADYSVLAERQILCFKQEMLEGLPGMKTLLRTSLYEVAQLAEQSVLNYSGTFARELLLQKIEEGIAAKETGLQEKLLDLKMKLASKAYECSASALEVERHSIEKDVLNALTSLPTSESLALQIDETTLLPTMGTQKKGLLRTVVGGIAGGVAGVVRLFSPKLARGIESFVDGVLTGHPAMLRKMARDVRSAHESRVMPAVLDLEAQWESVMEDLARDLSRQAATRMRDLKKQLNRLLDESSDLEVQRAERREELHAISQQLAAIENELRKLGGWIGTGTATA